MSTHSADQPADDLRARVATLEAENASLRSSTGGSLPPNPPHRHRRSRAVLATVLIVLGVLLAPIAVVAGWASWTLSDTDRFVATYAPLASSPEVRSYVVDEAMAAVEEHVDFDGLTKQLVDDLIALGTGPRGTAALHTLQGSLAEGLRTQVRDGLTKFVDSDKFEALWTEALRVGHRQLTATLSNDPAAVATISSDGSLGIPLGPIIEQAKARLVAQGIGIAARIPPVDRTIVLVQSDDLPAVQVAYGVLVGAGHWLPWVVLVLLVGGVATANRRHRAAVWAAAAFAFTMVLLALVLAAGRIALLAAVPASVLPASVSGLLYDTATDAMRSTAVSAAVIGVAVALVGWFAGPFRTPLRLRSLYLDGVAHLRTYADERGLSTGRFGGWVHRRRSLLLGLVALGAGAAIVLNRPTTVGLIGWTALWSLLAVVLVTLVERPEPTLPEPVPAGSFSPSS